MISLDSATRLFTQHTGFADVSFTFEQGKRYGVFGASGVGKSTLLRVLAGLDDLTRGRVGFDQTIRRSLVFQDFPLFPWRTVAENIELPRELAAYPANSGASHLPLEASLSQLGLTGLRDAYPQTLSGGMRQRVAVLQALANDPDVLLADEPFSALDFVNKVAAQRLLLQWHTGKRVLILISHDVEDLLALCDVILVLSGRPGTLKEKVVVSLDERDPLARRGHPSFYTLAGELRGALQ